MIWLVAVLVGLGIFLLVIKYQNFHGNISNFIVLGVMLFFILSLGYVYFNHSPDLSNLDGVVGFLKTYTNWVSAAFSNTGKIAGYAVKQDWTPELNLTNLSKK